MIWDYLDNVKPSSYFGKEYPGKIPLAVFLEIALNSIRLFLNFDYVREHAKISNVHSIGCHGLWPHLPAHGGPPLWAQLPIA